VSDKDGKTDHSISKYKVAWPILYLAT
jgi:hypothetical protein